MGSWELNMDTTDLWATSYTEAAADTTFGTANVAISSFPHNELGKDFRFNIRILLAETGGSTRQVSSSFLVHKQKRPKMDTLFSSFFPTRPSDEYDTAPSRKYSRPLLDDFACIG